MKLWFPDWRRQDWLILSGWLTLILFFALLALSSCAKTPNIDTASETRDTLGSSPVSRVWDTRFNVVCYYYVYGYAPALSCVKVN